MVTPDKGPGSRKVPEFFPEIGNQESSKQLSMPSASIVELFRLSWGKFPTLCFYSKSYELRAG